MNEADIETMKIEIFWKVLIARKGKKKKGKSTGKSGKKGKGKGKRDLSLQLSSTELKITYRPFKKASFIIWNISRWRITAQIKTLTSTRVGKSKRIKQRDLVLQSNRKKMVFNIAARYS